MGVASMIHDYAQIRFVDFLGKTKNSLEFVSRAPYRLLTENGRSAIFQGFKLLGNNKSDKTEVLVPAYNCGSEVEAIIRCGFKPVYYHIDLFCQPCIKDIKKKINKRTLAVMVTHFNGFPQPIEEIRNLCLWHDVYVVEDCAHVLKTEIPLGCLGTFGDISIFSLRKFIPISRGALLAINTRNLLEEFEIDFLKKGKMTNDLFILLKQCIKNSLISKWKFKKKNSKLIELSASSQDLAIEVHDFKEDYYDHSISLILRFLLERFNIEEIVITRRRNYAHLNERLYGIKGLRNLFAELMSGVCPWFYLVEVEDPWKLKKYLESKDIKSTVFWSWFHKDFNFADYPEVKHLKNHVIALPIHQDLSIFEINYIAEQIKKYFDGSRA